MRSRQRRFRDSACATRRIRTGKARMLSVIAIVLASMALTVALGVSWMLRHAVGLSMRDFLTPRIHKGELVIDHEPPEWPFNHLDNILGHEAAEKLRDEIAPNRPKYAPDVRLSAPGWFGYVDSHGVLRTEEDSTIPDGTVQPLAKVVELHRRMGQAVRRTGGEQ